MPTRLDTSRVNKQPTAITPILADPTSGVENVRTRMRYDDGISRHALDHAQINAFKYAHAHASTPKKQEQATSKGHAPGTTTMRRKY